VVLHVRQEGDELGVVALVEVARGAGVFVLMLAPGRGRAHLAQRQPGRTALFGIVGVGLRHQAQRPQQHLAQVVHRHRPTVARAERGGRCGGLQHGPGV
jgi:hypothetical protein